MHFRLVFVVLLAACEANGAIENAPDFHFDEAALSGGKRDGSAVLPEAELRAIEATLEGAIADAEIEIAALETEIASLESSNAAKLAQIDDLLRQVAARRREIEEEYERKRRNAVIFAFLGYPDLSTVSLVQAMNDDARLRQLDASLSAARSDADRLRADIADYVARRDAMRHELASLEATRDRLLEELRSPTPASLPEIVTAHPDLVALATRIETLEEIESTSLSQVEILTAMRDAALRVSRPLDAALRSAQALAQTAARLAEASREETYEVLKMLLSGEPEARARRWLDQRLAQETKNMLRALGLPPFGFVAHLLAGESITGRDRDELERALLTRISGSEPSEPIGPPLVVPRGSMIGTFESASRGLIGPSRVVLRGDGSFYMELCNIDSSSRACMRGHAIPTEPPTGSHGIRWSSEVQMSWGTYTVEPARGFEPSYLVFDPGPPYFAPDRYAFTWTEGRLSMWRHVPALWAGITAPSWANVLEPASGACFASADCRAQGLAGSCRTSRIGPGTCE